MDRYPRVLLTDSQYGPLIELQKIYDDILRDNLSRNNGVLDEEGRIIERLKKKVDTKIYDRLKELKRIAQLVDDPLNALEEALV